MKYKSQFSVEYLLIVSAAILLIASSLFFFFYRFSQESKMKDAEYTVDLLAKTANEIYDLGPGSRTYIKATIPSGIESIDIGGGNEKEIVFKVRIFSGTADVFSTTKPTVFGDLPIENGEYTVLLEKMPDGKVKIGSVCTAKDYEFFYKKTDGTFDELRSIDIVASETTSSVVYLKLPMPETCSMWNGEYCWMCDLDSPCMLSKGGFDIYGTWPWN